MIKRKDGFSGERALVLPASIIHTMENNPLANALHITDIGYYPRAEQEKKRTPINNSNNNLSIVYLILRFILLYKLSKQN